MKEINLRDYYPFYTSDVENRSAVSAHSHSTTTMPAALFPD